MVRKARFVFLQLEQTWKRKDIKMEALALAKKLEESERLSKNDEIGDRPSNGTAKNYQSYQHTIGSMKRQFSIQPKNLQFKIPEVSKMFDAKKSYSNRKKIVSKVGHILAVQSVKHIIRNCMGQKHGAEHACQDVGDTDTDDKLHMYKFLDKYLAGYCTQEFYKDWENIPKIDYSKLVCESFNYVREKSEVVQLKMNELLAFLFSTGYLSFDVFKMGFEEFLKHVGEIDLYDTDVWLFIAKHLAFFVLNGVIPINGLPDLLVTLVEAGAAAVILKHLISLIISHKGSDFLKSMWQQSGLKFTNFMSEDKVQSFISENKLEFLQEDKKNIRLSKLNTQTNP
ncbi:uncharacterized protein LOC115878688 isoform X2 [Sitophilus oryzae]|uniref:Uncharacterized protein LOC115878688 isoform X2 n=1 Tax=Sitophilus oryzae TaxID=7048 RepID=A0A6J2XJ35_SITOR|nr:uncharacterized protein LOC115878688 isoform X2 [Sitophilus oryzae]